jgi:RHS repeat-associated protein
LEGLNEFTEQAEKDLINEFFNVPDTADGVADSVALHEKAKQLLHHATVRFVYDFDMYKYTGHSAVVASIARETHYRKPDGSIETESKVQVGFEYSNGLGQVVMKKVQAEPGEAKRVIIQPDNTVTVDSIDTSTLNPSQLRWVGNGRTILNNKGNPVKQYEPYFSVTNRYEDVKVLVETGVTPVMYYDAAGRLIKTEMPDGTFSKVEFDSWKQLSYDPNDTVNESKWYTDRINNLINAELEAEGKDPAKEKAAAQKAALHFNTPAVIHLDTLGRPFCSIAHNKRKDFSSDIIIEEFYTTLTVLDTESNLRKVVDATGNTVMKYKYDILGNMLYQNSMDAGERWMLNDCMGKPVYAWDAKGMEFTTTYDELHRPLTTSLFKEGNTITTGRQEYVDMKGLTPAELSAMQQLNLIGTSNIQYESAGITRLKKVDFKGKPLETSRQLCKDYKTIPDWTNTAAIEMEEEIFVSSGEFDAMNRPVKMNTPHTADAAIPASVMMPVYNEAGVLDGMNVNIRGNEDATAFVININYDAKGQRESIYYSNNTVTRYNYDKKTFRLLRLLTSSNSGANILQDLRYTYDPVGNITFIKDASQPTVFYDGQQVKPENDYVYDATYQLIKATGREHIGQNTVNETSTNNNPHNFPFENGPSANDVQALRNYTQQYLYDAVGNILQMRHIAENANYTRNYKYNNNDAHRNELSIDATTIKNNQLLQTQIGTATPTRYTHDVHGNMMNLPHLMEMVWNYKDQLEQIDLGGGGKAYYVYDGSGQRIRKVIERNGGIKKDRLYLGAVEIYREKNSAGVVIKQTDTLHVMDDKSRIAMVETPVITDDFEEQQVIRFIYGNHLSSSSLELNENAVTISYEEFHPYGTTSFSATNADIKSAAKRYRYTGMERDEESGMAYHSARIYLNWLGRWLSADPIGISDGLNLFCYCNNNCISKIDPNGNEGDDFDTTDPLNFDDFDDYRIANPMYSEDLAKKFWIEEYGIVFTSNKSFRDGQEKTGGDSKDRETDTETYIEYTKIAVEDGGGADFAAGTMAFAGVLLADDVTGIGVADDVLIPPVVIGGLTIALVLELTKTKPKTITVPVVRTRTIPKPPPVPEIYVYRAMETLEGRWKPSSLVGAPNGTELGVRTPTTNPKVSDVYPDSQNWVSPSFPPEGLSSNLLEVNTTEQVQRLIDRNKHGAIGKVSFLQLVKMGLLPTPDPNNPAHILIQPAIPMNFETYQTLLNSVPWQTVKTF